MAHVLTTHFESLIAGFLASGRFNNRSEVIRAGLRLLEEKECPARFYPKAGKVKKGKR